MSGEVLKIDEYAELKKEVTSNIKSCSFYWIGAHMNGIEGRYSQETKDAILKELESNVNKCINWISTHSFANENNIESVFCE
jgi:hypothetical protein